MYTSPTQNWQSRRFYIPPKKKKRNRMGNANKLSFKWETQTIESQGNGIFLLCFALISLHRRCWIVDWKCSSLSVLYILSIYMLHCFISVSLFVVAYYKSQKRSIKRVKKKVIYTESEAAWAFCNHWWRWGLVGFLCQSKAKNEREREGSIRLDVGITHMQWDVT